MHAAFPATKFPILPAGRGFHPPLCISLKRSSQWVLHSEKNLTRLPDEVG